jgi:hypothetical protein
VNKTAQENGCQNDLADRRLWELKAKVDAEVAEQVRQGGCIHCGGTLHRANYARKPRGAPQQDQAPDEIYRHSFCCDQDGCRKRHTPPSVRFLGRKVYWGLVVTLVSAMCHGVSDQRLQVLRASLPVDRRTVERWREWWLQAFVASPYWQAARARFAPPLNVTALPGCLYAAFKVGLGAERRDRLLELLKFLAPITTGSIPWVA